MSQVPPTPLQAAIDRLVWEATYLRDVIHVAGPAPSITIATASLQQTVTGIVESINLLRSSQPVIVPTASGGAPAAPASGG